MLWPQPREVLIRVPIDSATSTREQRRIVRATAGAMATGLLFLVSACVLLGYDLMVAPVSRTLAYVAIGLGLLSATIILVAVFSYGVTERRTS